ncbi:helix-turn-helix transcriptional regulator (plasmid) [Paroceanicella profunda]|uniref:Helix-turn-helix transcriptional regulator n=1 Tax=Paroceanicella profunda TaxID=2579971 RepID=A0A5B8FJE7_9RHOB|nr:AraC family transcriptional regulator [Paroceanicella profunda]QDL94337.1 helix-turn-helix transcriptional regulator [Paroceanicella profunda]
MLSLSNVSASLPRPVSLRLPDAGTDRSVGDLLSRARAALDGDPRRARRCLDELASLLEPSAPLVMEESLLLPETPDAGARPEVVRGGLAQWQLRRVTRHVEANIGDAVPVDTLARLVGLSSGHFSRAFKVSTGETPHTFVIRKRLRRAQALMLTTNEPLGELACACGFTDQAHMTRLFRKFVGETPFVWRRAHRAC